MAKQTSSYFTTHDQAPKGSCGCAGNLHTVPAHDPGRFPSSRPRRTYLSEVRGLRSEVGAAAVAAILLLSLPCLALGAGQEAQPAIFDVAPGGILAALAAAATSALGTWAAMRNRPPRQRQSTRIEDQPIKVEMTPGHPTDPVCDAKHEAINGRLKDNTRDHENIFPRLTSLEGRVSVLEGVMAEIRITNKSVDDKLTILLRRK